MLRFIEGFERFPIGTPPGALSGRWQTNILNGSSFVPGRTGGYALSFEGDVLSLSLTAGSFYVVGFAFQNSSLNFPIPLMSLSLGGSELANLNFNPETSFLTLFSGNGSLVSSTVLSLGVWHYLELRCDFMAQTVTLYIDGTADVALDATGGVPVGTVNLLSFLGSNTGGVDYYLDDIYVLDSVGEVNNDILGVMAVEGIRPAGVGLYSQWSVTNSDKVNFEAVAISTGDFIYSNTVKQIDTYLFSPLRRITRGVINGIDIGFEARNTDLVSHAVAPFIITGTSTAASIPSTVDDTNSSWYDYLYEQNPVTQSNWQIMDFATSQFGLITATV